MVCAYYSNYEIDEDFTIYAILSLFAIQIVSAVASSVASIRLVKKSRLVKKLVKLPKTHHTISPHFDSVKTKKCHKLCDIGNIDSEFRQYLCKT